MRIDIIHKGKQLRRIAHQGDVYVQAPKRGQYKVKLYNNSNKRCLAVITVDGVNVISGKDGDPDDDGYVLRPWEILEIPGWRRNSGEVAAFTFKKREESYAPAIGKGVNNVGVIGVAVFDEKVKPIVEPLPVINIMTCGCHGHCGCNHHHHHWNSPLRSFDTTYYTSDSTSGDMPISGTTTLNELGPGFPDPTVFSCSVENSSSGGGDPVSAGTYPDGEMLGFGEQTRGVNDDGEEATSGRPSTKGGRGTRREGRVSLDRGGSRRKDRHFDSPTRGRRRRRAKQKGPQDVGTGYGQKVAFNTQDATFDRASTEPAVVCVLRYAVKERLESWGVPVQEMSRPEPFPATSTQVPAPPGWRG